MPPSASATNDQCEHCHSEYSLIKRKKNCAVCCQSFCTNCAPREQYQNHSYRICVVCQQISNPSTVDAQLLQIKVKHLRCYLQAKDISNNTCTEKQELVDLIKQNRQRPFTRLLNQQSTTTAATAAAPPPPSSSSSSSSKSGPFSGIQQTVSSFANQVNNFASNVQDYVSNTVSDVINTTVGDQPTTNVTTSSTNPPPRSTANPPPRPTANPPPQQQQRPAAAAAASASFASTANARAHRKSLSEINTEENIEDLNIRELKEILAANFVDYKGCVEKSELMERVRRLYRDRKQAQSKAQELGDSPATDTELCKICMDALVDCVFLDCGHMLTCVKCGKLLAECPICRSNIVRVVRVFKS